MTVIRMADLELSGKRVLIREDLNVPVADGTLTAINGLLGSQVFPGGATPTAPTLRTILERQVCTNGTGCAIKI